LAVFSVVLQMFSDFSSSFGTTVEVVAFKVNFEYICSTLCGKANCPLLMSHVCDGCITAKIFNGRDEG